MLQVKLLGQFDVRRDGTPVAIPSRAAQSLLAYLLLHAGIAHRREKLAGLLWPDTSEENARKSLRQELWRLRKVLAPEASLLSDDLSITFDASTPHWLDVSILEHNGGETASTDDLKSALTVYGGELLPGFYDEWVILERERLRALFEHKMARLLECLKEGTHWPDVLDWAEKWISVGHSPEPAFRALMSAYGASGDMAQVAATYQRCVQILRDDLGVEPSDQTRDLYDRLRARDASKVAPARSADLASSPRVEESPAPGEPPFKGLAHFDEADAHCFFGRERLIAELLAYLREHSLLVVIGASGSGKSSLVRAGLIPALRRCTESTSSLKDGADWQVYLLTPTAHPLHAMAVTLTREVESVTAAATLADDLERDPRSLAFALTRLESAKGTPRLLLVVDQFEELFTLCHDNAEREAFIDNLMAAVPAEGTSPIKVILALRADFYAHCAGFPALRQAVARDQAYIGPMTLDEMRRAIEAPAEHGGWEFEPGLVDLILRDVGDEPGALPLLSHALLESWKRRRGRTLTLRGYTESGGVRGSIAQTAETIYGQLSPERQAMARHIFMQLTELGEGTQDTRRRAIFEELVPPGKDSGMVREVLNTLAEARLVTAGENTAEVAHEALIREWPALREWLNQNREALQLRRRLAEAAQAWDKMQRDPGELYRGARLAQALEWAKGNGEALSPLENTFLEASKGLQKREEAEREAQRQRELKAARQLAESEQRRAETEKERAEEHSRAAQRLRRRALYLAGALGVAALLALAAVLFAQQSSQNAQRAENERRTAFVRELSVNSVNNLTIDPERSILLALHAVSVSTAGSQPVIREAEEALHRAVQASRLQLTLRGHTAGLENVAYSLDGKRLATASVDKTAKVWDAATGKELLMLCCHDEKLTVVTFSPDGKRLATSSTDKTAKIWDAATGKELLTLRGHTGYVYGVAFSPDGTRVATASVDKTAKIWDAATGLELLTLVGHTGGVWKVVYSPDGTRLATSSWSDEPEHTAKIWDATTGKLLLTLKGHSDWVGGLAFSPDGKRLATGSQDTTAKIWDVSAPLNTGSASGQLLLNLSIRSNPLSVAFSPDGTRLATGIVDGMAKVWDAATGELLLSLPGHTSMVMSVAFSPDGTRLATASNDGTAKVWDVTPAGSREWLTLAGHDGPVKYVAYNPEGTRLATVGPDKTAKVWDAVTGKLLLTLSGHTSEVDGVTFSPDGSRLATVSLDQTVRVWDTATGKPLLTISTTIFPFPTGLHTPFSPDGKRIATPGAGGSAKIWDALTGQELVTLCCHAPMYVRGIAFSPDGTRLATGGYDTLAKVFDASTGRLLLTLSGHTGGLWAVAYSPDGRWIATASNDGTAKVWDATTGKELFTLPSQTGVIDDVAFSPDGRRLATSGTEGVAKVWDVSSEGVPSQQPLTLYAPGIPVGAVWGPDGKRLAVASYDGTARVYALPLEDILAIAKSRVTRSLTADECQKYLHMEQCPAD